jgi:chromosome segregation ATPase
MLQNQEENRQSWECQQAERRIPLVEDDIRVAKRQIESLNERTRNLRNDLALLDFEIRELESHAPPPEVTGEDAASVGFPGDQGSFFTVLGELEREEAGLKAKIQSYKDQQRDLAHQRHKYQLQVQKVQAEIERYKEQLEAEETQEKQSEDLLKDLRIRLDRKTTELQELQQFCEDVRAECQALSAKILEAGDFDHGQMKSLEIQKLEEVNQAKKALERKQEALIRARNFYEKAAAEAAAKQQHNASVASWLGPRSIFTTKLRKAKEKLNTLERHLASAAKTEATWHEKFKKLLDGEDTDGTGDFAKRLVLAEIEERKKKKEEDANLARELRIEQDYHRELSQQKEMLTQSLRNFEEHKRRVLSELRSELEICGGKGYIDLLESELRDLKVAAARL